MIRRPLRGCALLLALGVSLTLHFSPSVANAPPAARPTAVGSFVKDRALARLLGETLFHDTVDVMSDPANRPLRPSDSATDKSAVAQVARTVLAQQKLDKYLWLIQQAYDDAMWKGGDRARIEQHFPLIWRTSILLYEAGLTVTPHRVRVCNPTETQDEFVCRDEVQVTRIVPIPAPPALIPLHQPTIG